MCVARGAKGAAGPSEGPARPKKKPRRSTSQSSGVKSVQLLARHVKREVTSEGHLPQIGVGERTVQRGIAEPKTLRGSQAAHCEPRGAGGQPGRRRRCNTPATAGHQIAARFSTTSAVQLPCVSDGAAHSRKRLTSLLESGAEEGRERWSQRATSDCQPRDRAHFTGRRRGCGATTRCVLNQILQLKRELRTLLRPETAKYEDLIEKVNCSHRSTLN